MKKPPDDLSIIKSVSIPILVGKLNLKLKELDPNGNKGQVLSC